MCGVLNSQVTIRRADRRLRQRTCNRYTIVNQFHVHTSLCVTVVLSERRARILVRHTMYVNCVSLPIALPPFTEPFSRFAHGTLSINPMQFARLELGSEVFA